MTTIHATGAVQVPRHLSPRRLTVSDRVARLRRSPAARDLRRVLVAPLRRLKPLHSVALLTGLMAAGLVLGLVQLRQGAPVSFGLVNGQ